MTHATRPPVCLDCGAPVRPKTPGKAAPKRCLAHRALRRREMHQAQEKLRVRPSRAKLAEPPRKCLDCDVLVYKTKTKWPLRCAVHATAHLRKLKRERDALQAQQDRKQNPTNPCADCGAPVVRGIRRVNVPLCPKCKAERARQRARDFRVANPEKCRTAESRWREQNPDKVRVRNARRRARLLGVEFEDFKYEEIFERDGWVCQICGHQIDPATKHSDPRSASLDHIIPISKHGPHTRVNVRLACLGCNSSKGDRLDAELTLVT